MTDKPRAADPDPTGSAPGGSAPGGRAEGTAEERVVIRNNRKINPAPDASASDSAAEVDTASTATEDADAPGAADGSGGGESTSVTPDGTDATATGGADETSATGGAQATTADDDAEATPAAGTAGGADSATDRVDDADVETGSPAAGEAPAAAGPVVDDGELAEVLQAQTPSGEDGPVVDAPAEGTGAPAPESEVDGAPGALGAELAALRSELEERTKDLQRVTAEYANYRKRVDRDKGLVTEQATGAVLTALLPILDDLDRAREHGDLVGPFGAVAEQLIAALGKFGLTPFGEKGDPFDPTRHEAVAHQTSPDVTEATCVEVMRRGYLLGDRLLRPAMVAVADPE